MDTGDPAATFVRAVSPLLAFVSLMTSPRGAVLERAVVAGGDVPSDGTRAHLADRLVVVPPRPSSCSNGVRPRASTADLVSKNPCDKPTPGSFEATPKRIHFLRSALASTILGRRPGDVHVGSRRDSTAWQPGTELGALARRLIWLGRCRGSRIKR